MTPFTGVTDSETSTRRRRKSTRPCVGQPSHPRHRCRPGRGLRADTPCLRHRLIREPADGSRTVFGRRTRGRLTPAGGLTASRPSDTAYASTIEITRCTFRTWPAASIPAIQRCSSAWVTLASDTLPHRGSICARMIPSYRSSVFGASPRSRKSSARPTCMICEQLNSTPSLPRSASSSLTRGEPVGRILGGQSSRHLATFGAVVPG